jgi:aminopeptidase-like protein
VNTREYRSFVDAIWFERRDIVSDGYDRAINYIKGMLPGMDIQRYKSGTNAWTWIIPQKWSVKKAYIKDGKNVLLDLSDHPLHVMAYSIPRSGKVSRDELLAHLHTRPEYPDLIPFEFSYYQKRWGFCIQHNRLKHFTSEEYEVLIDSSFEDGELKVGSLHIPGQSEEEIVLIAHLCHPCMVNDDLSGTAVLVSVAQHLLEKKDNYYSYRFLLLPETIGSIAFLSNNETLIEKMRFGVFLEMLGHDAKLSLQKSKQEDSLMDRAAEICLRESGLPFRIGKFHEVIANDERVFNGPGVNVPTISISRSNFWGRGEWPYPEYHSSGDTPRIISIDNLKDAESAVIRILEVLDENYCPRATVKGPVFLSRYGLWVDWRVDRELNKKQEMVFDYLHDGRKSIVDIAYELDLPIRTLKEWLDKFHKYDLIEKIRP